MQTIDALLTAHITKKPLWTGVCAILYGYTNDTPKGSVQNTLVH